MKLIPPDFAWLNLPNLPTPVKVLFSGYLLAIGLGLCMAGLQIMLTHGKADGKPGLSLDDIIYSYYGNRSGSTLESKLNGSMKGMSTPEARLDIIKWIRNGAPEAEWEPHFKSIFKQDCVQCHGSIPGIADFNKYEDVKNVAKIDEGASIQTLTRSSHIHLFGISFIFFFVGFIFSFAVGVPKWLKISAIATPFAFLIIDVFSWWLTKWNPNFAWLTLIGGFGYSVAATIMWFISMYQILILSRNGKIYGNAWEADLK
ncbi:MAG: elongation factor-1 alpha [Gammaproteobacteria bacterium]|nr:elongation factor-1 alpha [Gammaproteobacteria bacterium]